MASPLSIVVAALYGIGAAEMKWAGPKAKVRARQTTSFVSFPEVSPFLI
jgi:hypothetical protein